MEKVLTDVQKYMIEEITKAIKITEDEVKKASGSQKTKLRIRLNQLKVQLENAKKPVSRTPEEKAVIDKIVNKIAANTKVENVAGISGDRADKKHTSSEEFEIKLKTYLESNKNKIVEVEKLIAVQKEVYKVLNQHQPDSEETAYKQNLEQIKDNIIKLGVAVRSMKDRVADGERFVEEIIANYSFVSKLNRFLGNALNLSDYEEYANKLKNEIEKEF